MSSDTESLIAVLVRTINEGSPIFNSGKTKECFELYLDTAKYVAEQDKIAHSPVGNELLKAVEEASELVAQEERYSQAAWVLRHCFDDLLDGAHAKKRVGKKAPIDDESVGYWEDEKVPAQNDKEEGECYADIYEILKSSLAPQTLTYGFVTHENAIRGSDAIDLMTSLGVTRKRQVAFMKLQWFQEASMIVPLSHSAKASFRGGSHLYRYGTLNEMQGALQEVQRTGPHATGTQQAILQIALRETIASLSGSPSKRNLNYRASSVLPEQMNGSAIAQLVATLEKQVERKDRKWGVRPKVYEDCFIGNEAVTLLVDLQMARSRSEATTMLNEAVESGLVYHVTREHDFKDKHLFYKIATAQEVAAILEAAEKLLQTPTPADMTRLAALRARYRQFATLNIDDILNSFYGCTSKEGWDLIDLQNWRNNMKRWGFGRRDDQDDDMVDYLAPLVLNVDPEKWDKSGDEEWESPWGILAQIALFDQIPRSAFRGTADAFKWDQIAIRATKVAIEKGYFETAYKSTLNRFVVLLPLEHSEDWEDQKLGVHLLLQMLSRVAIEDEDDGHTPYEIVKRLEFSKRLKTAFLEHAQVIAKFKRYPHRNRQHGRTTTLEERIWLASDLVPRWAKSQNEDKGGVSKNIISLPVIPLKRLTKGR